MAAPWHRPRLALILLFISLATRSVGSEREGFTEPYRSVRVAADEAGIIAEVLVREGEAVTADQPLVRLNSEIHEALLAIARQNMEAAGKIQGATIELQLRGERWEKLQALRRDGYARQEEVDRAEAEYNVAEANLLSAKEELLSRKLEFERIEKQIARRTVRAPFAGVIASLDKDEGEFLSPNSPEILTLVQLDVLLANFALHGPETLHLREGDALPVTFVDGQQVRGQIEFISPVINAESGTILIKVRIDNPDLRLRSGHRCKIDLGA